MSEMHAFNGLFKFCTAGHFAQAFRNKCSVVFHTFSDYFENEVMWFDLKPLFSMVSVFILDSFIFICIIGLFSINMNHLHGFVTMKGKKDLMYFCTKLCGDVQSMTASPFKVNL